MNIVRIYEEEYFTRYWKLAELIEFLQSKMDEIPSEYKQVAEIDFSAYEDLECEISYTIKD